MLPIFGSLESRDPDGGPQLLFWLKWVVGQAAGAMGTTPIACVSPLPQIVENQHFRKAVVTHDTLWGPLNLGGLHTSNVADFWFTGK